MAAEVSIVPLIISAACQTGAVRVQYTVRLETDEYTGDIGTGETDLYSDEISEKVAELTAFIKQKMEVAAGLSKGDDNPLGDSPAVAFEDEDPL